jgi:hypothetical protein
MPNIFQATRFALTAIILLCTTLLATSCAKGKGKPTESLYGTVKAVQGQQYDAYVGNDAYLGMTPLYYDCQATPVTHGRGENATLNLKYECASYISVYEYSALLYVQAGDETFYLPTKIRSYEPLQQSAFALDSIGNNVYSVVPVKAHYDISMFKSWHGPGDCVFMAPHSTETLEEEATHFRHTQGDNRP